MREHRRLAIRSSIAAFSGWRKITHSSDVVARGPCHRLRMAIAFGHVVHFSLTLAEPAASAAWALALFDKDQNIA
jgi:hypothetical protein